MIHSIILCFLFVGFIYANNRWTELLFSNDRGKVHQGIKLEGNVNARVRGMTPLYHASRRGWGNIMELLLERGADIDAKSHGETPLLKVSKRGVNDVNLVQILLDYGADVNVQDPKGNTALYYAAINRNMRMIDLLLENGADMSIKNKRGDSAERVLKILNKAKK